MLQSAVPTARITAPSTSSVLRLTALGLAAALALSACNESQDKPPQAASGPLPPATESAQPVATPVAYVPPSAETLYQMVAPIALYPDKLVAQVLAASTYPDQVGAAEVWMGQNPGLKPEELQNAVNSQDWDPSVKSLAQFPNVLAQLSSNIPWTTALGKAYYNDPADVMNAIQVMRQRAYKAGTLKDSSRLKVAVATADAPPPLPQPAPQAVGEPLSSMLPVPVIDAPSQFIEIAPAQPDTVYVPQYDPGVVYGEPVPVYGGYRAIVAPQPVYVGSSAAPVVAGLIGFGAGVILAESVDRRPWGWNSWGMRWGEPGYRWHRNEPPPPPSRRPAVIYNNNTYVTRSTTVVQNIRNTQINNVGNVTHVANNPHFEPRRPDFPPQGGDPRSGDPRSGDPRSGGMAAAALAGAAGMAGAAAAAHGGMPQRLGLRPPQGGPPPSAQGMVPPGAAQGFARHDGADRGRPGLRPDDRPQASSQPRMNPVPASPPGQFGTWPQSPQSSQSTQAGIAQRPPSALPAAAMPGDRGRDSRVPSWSSAATQQGMRPQDRQDRDRSMADAARMRQQQQQQMEMQTARLRGEEQARQQQQQQAQRQAQMQAQTQARDQARDQAQLQARQQGERDRQAFQQRSQDQARQQQLQQQQQQQQQARAQEQMQARMQAQQQAQQQAQRQAQMQDRQAQQQRQQQFEAAQQQRMQAQQAQQAQAQARAQQQQQQQQARAQQEQRQQQQRMANASRPQERRGGRDERRDR